MWPSAILCHIILDLLIFSSVKLIFPSSGWSFVWHCFKKMPLFLLKGYIMGFQIYVTVLCQFSLLIWTSRHLQIGWRPSLAPYPLAIISVIRGRWLKSDDRTLREVEGQRVVINIIKSENAASIYRVVNIITFRVGAYAVACSKDVPILVFCQYTDLFMAVAVNWIY